MLRLMVLMWVMAGGAAVAQTTTGSVNPNPAPSQPATKDDVPPGGCMPMGVTASGEIVFPLECKAFLEQHRGNDPKQEPAAAEIKPLAPPQPPTDVKPPVNDAPTAAQPPIAVPQKSAAREETPSEKQPEAPTEKQPEAAVPKPAEVSATKDAETTATKEPEPAPAKEPEATTTKEPETTAAKEAEPTPAAKEPGATAAKEPEPPAQKQSDASTSEESRPAKPAPLSRHAEEVPRTRSFRGGDCTSYRTYDASSGTYRDFSGHRRPCR